MEGRFRSSVLHPEVQPAAWTLIAAAAIIVAVCYANSLPNGFILDDYQIVEVNPAIRTIAPLQLLKTPYWGNDSSAGIYRPLTLLSFSLEYPLWKRWAGGYRLTNLLLHTVNGLLIFILVRTILGFAPAAYAVSAIYLAHPVHTEPVVGLAGRGELLAAMFFLLAWICFRQQRVILCLLMFFLSLLSKENAIAFPAVILLDAYMAQGGLRKLLGQWKRFAAVAGVAFLYLGIRFWVLGSLGVPKTAQYLDGTLTFVQRELTSGRAFLKYFQLLIAPIDVTGDYDFNSIPVATLDDWVAWTGLLIVAMTLVFAWRMRTTQPSLSFAVLFFYITMLPSSNWIVPTSLIMSERALYLPSLGICLVGGLLWARMGARQIRRVLAVGVLAVAALLCIAHNYVWRDELTYFANMVRVFPDNVRGRQGYGVALLEAGRPDIAREQFEAGLKIRRNAPLLVGLGGALLQMDGRCSRARPVLQEALAIDPRDPFAPWLLGGCLEKEGQIHEAESAYREAVHNTPFPDPALLDAWGRTLQSTGRIIEAQEAFRRSQLLK